MSDTPLTFDDASKQLTNKQITWKEYLHHLFLHCLPQWHIDTGSRPINWWLCDNDPFAFSIWNYQERITDVTNSEQLEDVFISYERGGITETSAALDKLSVETAGRICTSLALLAIKDKNYELLKLTFERSVAAGFSSMDSWPSSAFRDMANAVNKEQDSELYALIEGSKWRKSWMSRHVGFFDPRDDLV